MTFNDRHFEKFASMVSFRRNDGSVMRVKCWKVREICAPLPTNGGGSNTPL